MSRVQMNMTTEMQESANSNRGKEKNHPSPKTYRHTLHLLHRHKPQTDITHTRRVTNYKLEKIEVCEVNLFVLNLTAVFPDIIRKL